MKNSIFNAVCKTRYLALLVVLILGSGNVWGATYTITFKTASSDPSTAISTSETITNIVSEGSSNIKSLNTCTKCYGPAKSGLKLGTGSATGTFKFTLSDALAAKTIRSVTVKTVAYGSDDGNITGTATGTNAGSLGTATKGTDLVKDYTASSTTKITTIQVATSTKRAYISQIIIETIESATTSTLTVSKSSISSGLTYVSGSGPSSAQTFTVSGADLTANVTVSAPTNFEVSTDGSSYAASQTITASGTLSTTTVYVRLKSGLAVNSYSGNITVASTGATSKTVSLSGSVTAPAYTVQFSTGTGNPTVSSRTEASAGAGITLPAGPTPACSGDGWSFAGWGYESCDDESTEPTLYIAGNKYYPSSNETLYAVYVKGKTASTNYKLISDAAQIVSGENYVIAAYYNSNDYAITAEIQSSYYIKQTAVTITENVISSPGAKIIWQLTNEGGSNVSLYNSNQGKYLYVYASGSYRNLGLYDSKKQFTMTEEREAGYASTFAFNSTDYTSYYINYDASHTDFGTKTSSDENLYLYKRQYTGTYESNPTCCTPHTISKAGSPAGTVTGGTFSTSVASACEGVEVTLNATPSSSAYKFGGWTITNGSSTDITTTVLGDGHAGDNPATMTMPNEAVTVNATFVSLSSIAVQTPPTKTVYLEGENFDPTGLVITRNYSNSTSDTYTYAGHEAEFTFSPTTSTSLTTSNTAVTITYSGQTANQSINVWSVTRQALDENNNAIAAGGPGSPTFTVATRGITPAADAANYKFWKWTISGAELGSAATTKTNTITNPTGNVTVTAVYYLPRTVTWLVNGEEWKPYTDAGSGTDGTAVVTKGVAWSTLTLPSDPAPPCGDKFVGWTIVDIGSAGQATDAGLDLMTSANKSDKTGAGHNVNDNITFHAVFADYVE